jgi:hypothetical protein
MKSLYQATAFVALMLAGPATAMAAPIPIASSASDAGLGSFTGTIDYDPVLFALTLSLTNTSPAPNGGYLVALAFNNPGNGITDVSLTSTDSDFGLIGGAGPADFRNDISVSPFGNADIGASLHSSWLGGGSPVNGIPVGGSATFTFTFTGSGLGALTVADFVNTPSEGGQDEADWLMVRFRGFQDGGSDKVGTSLTQVRDVPEPVSLLLLGGGLAALAARRRSQKSLK